MSKKMSLTIKSLLAVSVFPLIGCLSSKNNLPELTAPPAPFKESKDLSEAIISKGEVVGREIIFGSKKLIVEPSGSMMLMSEGRNICRLFFYVNTNYSPYLTNEDRGKIPLKWQKAKGSIGITESKYDSEKKQFLIKGNFPLNKPETGEPAQGEFIETVTLLETGKIKIENQYIIPKEQRSDFKTTSMFLKCSGIESFIVAEKKHIFEENTQRFHKPSFIQFAKGGVRDSFDVDVLLPAVASATKRRGKGDFRISPYKTDKVSFILDLGKVFKEDVSTYGGVDFKKTEDMDVPNYSVCRNLIQNPSFERGVMYCIPQNHFNHYLGINDIKADKTEALFGKHSLKATARKDGYYISLSPVPTLPGKYVFSYYLKGDASKNQKLRSYILNASRVNLAQKIQVPGKEWTRVLVPFEVKKMTAVSCCLMVYGDEDSVIRIDGIQLERGENATEFTAPPIESLLVTSKEDNFFSQEDQIDASLQISTSKPETSGIVKVTVKDFFSSKKFEEEYSFKTDETGVASINLPFNDRFSNGIHMVKADYLLEDGRRLHNYFRFSIMPFLQNKHKHKAMFANSYGGGTKREVYPGLETYLKRCRAIGTGGDTHAGYISKEFEELTDKYGIQNIDAYMAGALYKNFKKVTDAKGRKFFALCDDTIWRKGAKILAGDFRNEGDGKLTDKYLKQFEEAVMTLVKKYPSIPRWAFAIECWAKWPEWLTDDMESFANLQVAFYEAAKKANPDIQVYNGSPCNFNPEGGTKRVRKILEEINGRIKYDALSIHTYLPDGPYSWEANMEAFFDMAKEFGYINTPTFYPEGMHYGPYNIPQWGTVSASWGPPRTWYYGTLSYDMGWTEKLSAAWFARSWLICMKFMDRVVSATSSANNAGNFRLDAKLTPRAYQKVPNTLGNLLGNSKFVEDVSFAPETKCLVFEDDKQRPVAAVWGKIQKVDEGLEHCPWGIADFNSEDIEIFDLMESQRQTTTHANDNVRFPVSTFPFFIRGKAGTTKKFCETLRNSKMVGGNLPPLKMTAKVVGGDTVNVNLSNQISRNVKGFIKVSDVKKDLDVAPRKTVSFKVKMPTPLSASKITDVKIPVSITEKGALSPQDKVVSFEGFMCPQIATPIVIDGKEDDWKNAPAIELKNITLNKKTTGEMIGHKGDFEGSFKVAWNKENLYLMVKIKDDYFVHQKYKNNIAQRWNNDSLQIFIDTRCDARERKYHGYDSNDYDYAIFPDGEGKATTFRFKSPDQQLTLGTEAPDDRTVAKYIPSAFRKTNDGYIYEVAFPSKYLLPAKLEENYTLGFSLYVNDRDKSKNTKQALTLTPSGTGSHGKPHLYPVMLLTK